MPHGRKYLIEFFLKYSHFHWLNMRGRMHLNNLKRGGEEAGKHQLGPLGWGILNGGVIKLELLLVFRPLAYWKSILYGLFKWPSNYSNVSAWFGGWQRGRGASPLCSLGWFWRIEFIWDDFDGTLWIFFSLLYWLKCSPNDNQSSEVVKVSKTREE